MVSFFLTLRFISFSVVVVFLSFFLGERGGVGGGGGGGGKNVSLARVIYVIRSCLAFERHRPNYGVELSVVDCPTYKTSLLLARVIYQLRTCPAFKTYREELFAVDSPT